MGYSIYWLRVLVVRLHGRKPYFAVYPSHVKVDDILDSRVS